MDVNSITAPTQQQSALYEGIENLTQTEFTFTQYTIMRLSQDGYVFWVKGTNTITVRGALHIGTDREQEIDDTIAQNSVILDAEAEITAFNTIGPTTLWIGEVQTPDGATVKIAFQRRGPFFANAGVYHYAGFAVFPPFAPQIVESSADIPAEPIVSNSLPFWLSFSTSAIPVYPSYLVPENAIPPYVAVHIEPDLTKQIQVAPLLEWSTSTPDPNQPGFYDLTSYQLMQDSVSFITYGLNNQQAWQLIYRIIDQSWADKYGFLELPTIRDEKRTQPEIMALAMKKTIDFKVDYNMGAADAVARRLIESATVSFTL